ncbi:hypothetical protein PLICRDRAFT_34119 [Plicaturopsis crispa FD-325 SS-3]|nr:hypothetical protein PLICRDRAFT_34119 [Plicaturopsis crispa FD-325 SS-3]
MNNGHQGANQGNAIIPVTAIVTPEDYEHNNARLQHMRDVLASWEVMNEEGRRNYIATEQAKEELRRRAEEGEAAKRELERLDAEERNRRRFSIPAVSAVGRMLPAPHLMPPSNQAQSNPAQRHYRPQSYTQQHPATATIVEVGESSQSPRPSSASQQPRSNPNHQHKHVIEMAALQLGYTAEQYSNAPPERQAEMWGQIRALVASGQMHTPQSNGLQHAHVQGGVPVTQGVQGGHPSHTSYPQSTTGHPAHAVAPQQNRTTVHQQVPVASSSSLDGALGSDVRYRGNSATHNGPHPTADTRHSTIPPPRPGENQVAASKMYQELQRRLGRAGAQQHILKMRADALSKSKSPQATPTPSTVPNASSGQAASGPSNIGRTAVNAVPNAGPKSPSVFTMNARSTVPNGASGSYNQGSPSGSHTASNLPNNHASHLSSASTATNGTASNRPTSNPALHAHYPPLLNRNPQGVQPNVPNAYPVASSNSTSHAFAPHVQQAPFPPLQPGQHSTQPFTAVNPVASSSSMPFPATHQESHPQARSPVPAAASVIPTPERPHQTTAPRTPHQADKRRLARDILFSLGKRKRDTDDDLPEPKVHPASRASTPAPLVSEPSAQLSEHVSNGEAHWLPIHVLHHADDGHERADSLPLSVSETKSRDEIEAEAEASIAASELMLPSTPPRSPHSESTRLPSTPATNKPPSLIATPQSSPSKRYAYPAASSPAVAAQQPSLEYVPPTAESHDADPTLAPEPPSPPKSVDVRAASPLREKTPLFLPSPESSPQALAPLQMSDKVDELDDDVIILDDDEVDVSVKSARNISSNRKQRQEVYVLIPPTPRWVTKALASEQKRAGKRRARSKSPEIIDVDAEDDVERPAGDELAEKQAVQLSSSRIRECPCQWKGCDVVMNSAEKLRNHVVQHANDLVGPAPHACLWTGCTRRLRDESKIPAHLEFHARIPLFCAYRDCDDSFRTPRELLQHHLLSHRSDHLRRTPAPYKPPVFSAPPAPKTLPTYMVEPQDIRQPGISRERHARLGTWVLRNIFGPVNLGPKRHNAAVPLRRVRRDPGPEDPNAPPPLRPDEYDFLSSTSNTRSRTHFGDLLSHEVSELVYSGHVFFAPSPTRGDTTPLGRSSLPKHPSANLSANHSGDGDAVSSNSGVKDVVAKAEDISGEHRSRSASTERGGGGVVVEQDGWSCLQPLEDEENVDMML